VLLAWEVTHKDGSKTYRFTTPDAGVCFCRIAFHAHMRAERDGGTARLVELGIAREVSPLDVHPADCRDVASHITT
jgi:hypothetical protein